MSFELLPDVPASLLVPSSSSSSSLLALLPSDKPAVIDMWTTKCVRCPAALDHLNGEAAAHPEVAFFSCVLDNPDVAVEIVEEGGWDNMTHISMDAETKEIMKAKFNFTQVPFCLVVSKDRRVVAKGNPKDIDLPAALSAAATAAPATAEAPHSTLVLDEDF